LFSFLECTATASLRVVGFITSCAVCRSGTNALRAAAVAVIVARAKQIQKLQVYCSWCAFSIVLLYAGFTALPCHSWILCFFPIAIFHVKYSNF